MTAPPKIYPYEPRFHFEPPDPPDIHFLPSGVKPTVDGYPWWVDPPGFLSPPPAQELPPFQLGPTDFGNQLQNLPTNWLQSYYDQNFAQQGGPHPDYGIGPATRNDAAQTEVPMRKLGRRTYRA